MDKQNSVSLALLTHNVANALVLKVDVSSRWKIVKRIASYSQRRLRSAVFIAARCFVQICAICANIEVTMQDKNLRTYVLE